MAHPAPHLLPQTQSQPQPHAVLFPFMFKGHTIPLLQLARLILRRRLAAVTVITTPANRPFISASLSGTAASIISIPFPENAPHVPAGVESTDQLPSAADFFHLANATKLMRPEFDRILSSLQPPPTFLVSDGFLGWTLHTARALSIPRFFFYGMSNHAFAVTVDLAEHGVLAAPRASDDEPFAAPSFPWMQVTLNDFDPVFKTTTGPQAEFHMEQIMANAQSQGVIVNSFEELEPVFLNHCNQTSQPKGWCVGSLCLAAVSEFESKPEPESEMKSKKKPKYLRWLDNKLDEGKAVLYVAFGSQEDIAPEQIRKIAAGLEESGLNFLWVLRKKDECGVEFEDERVEKEEGRGLVLREWVDQMEVLRHESVEGFVSHCGWNSVIESVSAAVPLAAWPMMADQHLNARLVVEELKMGVRVETCNGSVRGFVKREGLKKTVRELMEGEKGKEAWERVREAAAAAKKAVAEGGSSWRTLEDLISDACGYQKLTSSQLKI